MDGGGVGVGVGVGELRGVGVGVVGWRSLWEWRAGPLFLLAFSASRTVVVVEEVLTWRFPVLYKDKVCYVFYNICVLMFMYYTVCYFTGIFYAVVRQISMLFIGNQDSVFCTVSYRCPCWRDSG